MAGRADRIADSSRLILITGGSGYVGSALVPVIARRYRVRVFETMTFGNSIGGTPHVEFVQADIRDGAAVATALRGVTDVIHLAGIVTDELVDLNPGMALEVNVDATRRLCHLAVEAGVQRFIFASSSSVYGSQDLICTETTEPRPQTTYAGTKLAGEELLAQVSGKMTTISVRCATLCGPAPRMRLDTIVNTFCKQAFFDHVITVHGGGQYRTNVHVQDVADFYNFLLDAPARLVAGEVFNFTLRNDTALNLGKMVLREASSLRIPVTLRIDSSRRDDRSYRMDNSKARNILRFMPKRALEAAIVEDFHWFVNGKISDPNDALYYNTRRMAPILRGEA